MFQDWHEIGGRANTYSPPHLLFYVSVNLVCLVHPPLSISLSTYVQPTSYLYVCLPIYLSIHLNIILAPVHFAPFSFNSWFGAEWTPESQRREIPKLVSFLVPNMDPKMGLDGGNGAR